MATREAREAQKARWERYRVAAARLSGGIVRPLCAVTEPADQDGAYVEVVIWVPREEANREPAP